MNQWQLLQQYYNKSGLKLRYRAARTETQHVCLNEVSWKSSVHEIYHEVYQRLASLAKYSSNTIKNTKQMSSFPTRIRVRTACGKPQQNPTFLLSLYMWSDVCVSWHVESTNSPAGFSGKCFTRLAYVSCFKLQFNTQRDLNCGLGVDEGPTQQNQTPKPGDIRMAHFSR